MPRISGVDIPMEKRVGIGLTHIYGIGLTVSQKILDEAGVSHDTKIRDLTEEEISHMRAAIDRGYKVEGDLRREINFNIKRLVDIGSYRGMRHRRGLPVHGQRTRTNARAKKGSRRPVASRRRAVAKK